MRLVKTTDISTEVIDHHVHANHDVHLMARESGSYTLNGLCKIHASKALLIFSSQYGRNVKTI